MGLTISAKLYDIKVTIEKDNSDVTIDELMQIFENITISLGYQPESWKNLILEMAEEIKEDDIKEDDKGN